MFTVGALVCEHVWQSYASKLLLYTQFCCCWLEGYWCGIDQRNRLHKDAWIQKDWAKKCGLCSDQSCLEKLNERWNITEEKKKNIFDPETSNYTKKYVTWTKYLLKNRVKFKSVTDSWDKGHAWNPMPVPHLLIQLRLSSLSVLCPLSKDIKLTMCVFTCKWQTGLDGHWPAIYFVKAKAYVFPFIVIFSSLKKSYQYFQVAQKL